MCTDWMRAMFDKSIERHGKHTMVVQFVFLFLVPTISKEPSREMDFRTVNVIIHKFTMIFCGLYSYQA